MKSEPTMTNTEFWLVWNPNGRPPMCQHECETDAKREAERLARVNPGERFFILHARNYAKVESPKVEWFEMGDWIPF